MKRKCFVFLVLVLCGSCAVAFAATGKADIKGTTPGSTVSGTAVLTDTPDGLKVSVDFEDAPPGKHGFHIHEFGECGDEGKAAGGHFNPDSVPHGLVSKDGMAHAHAGDFGNVEITDDGEGRLETVIKGLTLTGGSHSVAGHAFILHEKEDDFGQPTGNAGGRIGCGKIEVTG